MKIPNRYAKPKWQAKVKPDSKGFFFGNGGSVLSIWDLKQELVKMPEDFFLTHVSGPKNDLADWLEFCVMDLGLADMLRKRNYRWGMIVDLESYMDQQADIPKYLAKRWLGEYENFICKSGDEFNCLKKMVDVMDGLDDETWEYHLERSPNDFSVWLVDVVGDYELGQEIDGCGNLIKAVRLVRDRIALLDELVKD